MDPNQADISKYHIKLYNNWRNFRQVYYNSDSEITSNISFQTSVMIIKDKLVTEQAVKKKKAWSCHKTITITIRPLMTYRVHTHITLCQMFAGLPQYSEWWAGRIPEELEMQLFLEKQPSPDLPSTWHSSEIHPDNQTLLFHWNQSSETILTSYFVHESLSVCLSLSLSHTHTHTHSHTYTCSLSHTPLVALNHQQNNV